jgi:hypothetical protein
VRANLKRWARVALVVVAGSAMCPAPLLADTKPAQPIRAAVGAFSSTSVKKPEGAVRVAPARREQNAQSTGQSFFQSPKGAVALGLMIGGAALTVWSINHDRKPVKSPVR